MKENNINLLPITRKAHFKDSLKNRWRLLLKCDLLLILGFLPIFISILCKNVIVSNLIVNENYFLNNSFTETGLKLYRIIELINLASITVLSVIFSLILSGIMQIIKKIC